MLLSLGYTCSSKRSPIKIRNESNASLGDKFREKIKKPLEKENSQYTQSISSTANVEGSHAYTLEHAEDSDGKTDEKRSKREKIKESFKKLKHSKHELN